MVRRANGKVYIVGAGPGDPNLLTLRGLKALRIADTVIYDRLVNKEILEFAPEKAVKLYADEGAGHNQADRQARLNKLMVSEARKGKTVVRLKGGDPFIFGRGGEEAEYLVSKSVDFEIVPGVTSAIAAPAYAGVPLTHRTYSSSVAIVTGHEDPSKKRSKIKWSRLASSVDTIVILMGASTFKLIARELIAAGMAPATPVAIIEHGTTDAQRCLSTTLQRATEDGLSFNPPCTIVVGEVARLAKRLAWFHDDELAGGRSAMRTLGQSEL